MKYLSNLRILLIFLNMYNIYMHPRNIYIYLVKFWGLNISPKKNKFRTINNIYSNLKIESIFLELNIYIF